MKRVFTVIASIAPFFVGGIVMSIQNQIVWSIALWSIAVLIMMIGIVWISRRQNDKPTNWITGYKEKSKRLPPIPEYLLPVIQNYEVGKPISHEIKVRPMSGQFYNNLLPSQIRELKTLIEWLGYDWDDYVEQMKRMLPKSLDLGQQ